MVTKGEEKEVGDRGSGFGDRPHHRGTKGAKEIPRHFVPEEVALGTGPEAGRPDSRKGHRHSRADAI